MGKRPTEEDLGIAPTVEEMAEHSSSQPQEVEDDIPSGGSDDGHHIVAQPKPEGKPEDKVVAVRDPTTGKFAKADEAAEAKPAAETTTQPAAVKPPPGFVDQRALREAREQNKMLEERFNTLMEVINKRPAPKEEQPAAPVAPDKVTDPYGFMDHVDGRLAAIENESKAQRETREASEREAQEVGRALSVARPQFEEAAKADPALAPTYNALLESYAREIAYLSRANPAFLQDQRGFLSREMTKLENGHIKFAVASGQNVVEYMRGLAQSRGIGTPAGQPAPQQQMDAAAGQPKSIAERQQQRQRHQSLGDLPGTGVPGQLTAKDIARMSPAQFKKLAKDLGESGLDAMMGKE